MKKIFIIATTLLFLGCNSSTNNKTANTSSDNPSSDSTTKSSAIQVIEGSDIKVTLTGGPNAGIYHVMSKDPTCSEGLTNKNSFGNQYSETGKNDNELSSLQLIIDDKNAAKNGTDRFSIEVEFGKLPGGKSYEINTRNDSKDGSGKATLTENGGTKTVVVEGKTKDGIGISATLICNKVMTANGIQ